MSSSSAQATRAPRSPSKWRGPHEVLLSGAATGAIPFRPESVVARVLMPFIARVIFHRVLTTRTPIGRRVRRKWISTGEPLIRVKPKDLAALGVERVPRVAGIESGLPQLEDGRSVDVANVICARDSTQGSPGSTSQSWAFKSRFTVAGSLRRSPASTSLVSSSCIRSPLSRSTASDATPTASPGRSPRGAGCVGWVDPQTNHPRSERRGSSQSWGGCVQRGRGRASRGRLRRLPDRSADCRRCRSRHGPSHGPFDGVTRPTARSSPSHPTHALDDLYDGAGPRLLREAHREPDLVPLALDGDV